MTMSAFVGEVKGQCSRRIARLVVSSTFSYPRSSQAPFCPSWEGTDPTHRGHHMPPEVPPIWIGAAHE